MDQTASSVRQEMDAMERSFHSFVAADPRGVPAPPMRWAGSQFNPQANP